MRARGRQLWSLVFVGLFTFGPGVAARAMEAIDFDLSAARSQSAAPTPRGADHDEDEDAFFSSAPKRQMTTGSVATIGRLPAAVAAPRPIVDIAETCRAVLADNLNYYNHHFIQGCQRTVAQAGRR